jgi:hypothetical protein
MEKNNINLLDLDNDILNIIGAYVIKDNNRRIRKEDNFNETDFIMDYLKKKMIYIVFYLKGYHHQTIEEFEVS